MSSGRPGIDGLSGWPEPFTPAFVEHAVDLLELHGAVSIVGARGAHRSRLATLLGEQRGKPTFVIKCRHSHRKQAHWLTRKLLRQLGVEIPVNDDELVATISHTLANAAQSERLPTVVLVEAEFSDAESRLDLAALVNSHTIRVATLLTAVSAHRHDEILSRSGLIQLQPLDFATVSAAVQTKFGLPVQPEVVRHLLSRSQGNYGTLQEVTAHAIETGTIAAVEGVLILTRQPPRRVTTRVGTILVPRSSERLADLAGAAELLDLVALIGEVEYDEAVDCVGTKCVKSAIKHGALVENDGVVTMASAAEGELMALSMSQQRQRDLHRTFGERCHRSMRRAMSSVRSVTWLRAIEETPDSDLLYTAAVQANLAGLYDRVIEWTDGALDGPPVAAIERAYALRERGDIRAFTEWLGQLNPADLTDDELLVFARMRWMMGLDRWPASNLEGVPPVPDARQSKLIELADLMDRATEFNDEAAATRLHTMTLDDELPPLRRIAALTALAFNFRSAAQIRQAVAASREAVELVKASPLPVSASYSDPAHEILILNLITETDYLATNNALHDYIECAAYFGNSPRFGDPLWSLLELFRGDIAMVLARSQLAVTNLEKSDPHRIRSWMAAISAQALAQAGRTEEAKQQAELSRSLPTPLRRQFALECAIAQGCAMDSIGDSEGALDLMDAVYEEARLNGHKLVQIDTAVLRVQIGGQEHLPLLLSEVEKLTHASGTPAVWQQFAHACSANECHTLYEMTHQLSKSGAAVLSAEIAQFVLDQPLALVTLSEQERSDLAAIADPMSHRSRLTAEL